MSRVEYLLTLLRFPGESESGSISEYELNSASESPLGFRGHIPYYYYRYIFSSNFKRKYNYSVTQAPR